MFFLVHVTLTKSAQTFSPRGPDFAEQLLPSLEPVVHRDPLVMGSKKLGGM